MSVNKYDKYGKYFLLRCLFLGFIVGLHLSSSSPTFGQAKNINRSFRLLLNARRISTVSTQNCHGPETTTATGNENSFIIRSFGPFLNMQIGSKQTQVFWNDG